jgi:pyruvate dehydrogenase E2 component (dihydrolipoamide acetyltransferase)
MSNEITMPKLSDTMEEGKILRWLKHPGDEIHHGDAIAEVETDKADMVMESFDDGVLESIMLKEGESAKVGAVIAVLRVKGAAARTDASPSSPAEASNGDDAAADAATPVMREAHREESEEAEADDATGATSAGEGATGARATMLRPAARRRRGANGGAGATAKLARTQRPSSKSSAEAEDFDDGEAAGEAEEHGEIADSVGEPPPEFHPALSGVRSAGPTSIPAPPHREIIVTMPTVPATHGEGGKFRASPLARRAAEEAGIDLSHVTGSGPDGRITKRDVDNFVREQQLFKFRRLIAPREGMPGTREELSKMRKTIAHRMAQSKREIPHFYVTVEIDMEESVKLKSSLEATELFEEDITYNDIVVKATALALSRYTRMNASYQDDGIVIFPHINIGMAVAVEDGLIVPVIHECERLTLPQIASAAHRLVTKAARGGFTPEDLSGATFTISNMGMLGVEHFAAVIVPPQAAILAVSAIKDRPVVRNGQLGVGKTMMMTVACDHRIIDGVIGARFLNEIKRFLENPASLLV